MAVDSGVVEKLEAQGMGAVREEQGLCALELAMLPAWGLPVRTMVPLHWPGLVMQMARGVPLLLRNLASEHMHLLQQQQHTRAVVAPPTNSLISSLLQLPTVERAAKLEAMVLEHVVSMGGQPEMGVDEPLMEAGLDSLAMIELTHQLSQSLGDGVILSATVLFDHPTISRLAAHIGSLLCWEEPVEAHVVELAVSDMPGQASVMVAGGGCVLPGASDNSAKFWCLLSNAVDPICSVPSGRWDERQHAESSEQVAGSKCYVQCGGFVAGLEGFDNKYFRISASEAKQMDPQQRAVLEVCLLHCVFGLIEN
jgi:aryl carrier-like protein